MSVPLSQLLADGTQVHITVRSCVLLGNPANWFHCAPELGHPPSVIYCDFAHAARAISHGLPMCPTCVKLYLLSLQAILETHLKPLIHQDTHGNKFGVLEIDYDS